MSQEETVVARLELYNEETKPLIDHYSFVKPPSPPGFTRVHCIFLDGFRKCKVLEYWDAPESPLYRTPFPACTHGNTVYENLAAVLSALYVQ